MSVQTQRKIPYADLKFFDAFGRDTRDGQVEPLTFQEWLGAIKEEVDRRTVAAADDAYVAVPAFRRGFTGDMFQTWSILGPRLEVPTIDAHGDEVHRLEITIGVAGEGGGRQAISEFVEPYADDLAAALTMGRRARLRGDL